MRDKTVIPLGMKACSPGMRRIADSPGAKHTINKCTPRGCRELGKTELLPYGSIAEQAFPAPLRGVHNICPDSPGESANRLIPGLHACTRKGCSNLHRRFFYRLGNPWNYRKITIARALHQSPMRKNAESRDRETKEFQDAKTNKLFDSLDPDLLKQRLFLQGP